MASLKKKIKRNKINQYFYTVPHHRKKPLMNNFQLSKQGLYIQTKKIIKIIPLQTKVMKSYLYFFLKQTEVLQYLLHWTIEGRSQFFPFSRPIATSRVLLLRLYLIFCDSLGPPWKDKIRQNQGQ